jgi:photosystem II stability/assembly factor-like uncharacterized protein
MHRRLRTPAVFLAFAIGLLIDPAAQAPPADTSFEAFRWRGIGNANQRGRISSIDALDDDWTHVVVGTASGGVFKSVNGGTSWTPIFDNYGAASIGDVRIFQKDPNIIWVGAGEECGRNSATWGNGVYKSTDGGKTFQHMGLADTYTIGSIVTHPTDPNIVYVAALGNIWAPIGNRGLYKSTDGGKTWNKLSLGLPADDKRTGALYIVMHPADPDTLWVSFWGRDRTPYRMTSGGPNGGIFKTTNGGKTFQKLTRGLPEGDSGKIGLAVSRSNPRVLMAHYEHGYQPARDSAEYKDLSKPGSGIYRSEDGGASWSLVNRYFSRPFYYNHVAISPLDDKLTIHYNQNLQYSTDGGRTLQPFTANGGGHCWHAIWMDPHNKKRFYTGSDGGVTLTHDSGQTWVGSKNLNVTQYYMLGVDMRDPYYVCGGLQDAGTSCGPSMTRANGIYLNEWYSIQGGDGYHIQVDPTDWRTVYSGQDPRNVGTEVSRTDVVTRLRLDIRPHKGVNIVNYDQYITPQIEAEQLKKGWGEIPKPGETFNYRTAGGGAFRWNWETPIVLSPFGTPRSLYVGANHLFRTDNRGDTWTIVSPDLTKNDPEKTRNVTGGLTSDVEPGGGAEHYGTIVTIGESPVRQGVIWVGTDDGNVQVTRDGGKTWTNVAKNMKGLPSEWFFVSRVRPSKFEAATAFVTLEGHESGNFDPWVFKTTDYGATWTNITNNLPKGDIVWVIEQDRVNPDLLFVGTELAIYVSTDGGTRWAPLRRNLPVVAVRDIVVHPRDPDLIIGTHGRGIWIMDDISALQQMTPAIGNSDVHLFANEVATKWNRVEPMHGAGDYGYQGENPTKNGVITYWTKTPGKATIEISDETGKQTRQYAVDARAGINKLEWDLLFNVPAAQPGGRRGGGAFGASGPGRVPRSTAGGGPPVGTAAPSGTYRVRLTQNGRTATGTITVRDDPQGAES